MDDVYEPLEAYRSVFRDKFAKLAQDKFRELVERSGVDVAANRATAAAAHKAQETAQSHRSRKILCGFLIAAGIAVCIAGALLAVKRRHAGGAAMLVPGAGAVAGAAVAALLAPHFKRAGNAQAQSEEKARALIAEGWRQMAPLNGLYTWDVAPKLAESTVPKLAFDPYFTAERLDSLRRRYGWDDSFNEDKSVLGAQSGTIAGNPFVFAHCLQMEWGEETYTGTKTISWLETETDAEGRSRTVRRYQTLVAHVTKPLPVYSELKLLIYGNDAAPDLCFSREPSGMSGDGKGLSDRIRKAWRLGRLKAYSRNLADDSNFTLMANHEFETWFHAKDRTDEVQFRLLFTPVAQTQMLALMKDDKTGYGDDFSFLKIGKTNVLGSAHLNASDLDTDPAKFRNWDIDAAAKNFLDFHVKFFKDAYFSLAPVLAIPLYQQTRPPEEIWRGAAPGGDASFWEMESLANYWGEKRFKHPQCITRSILKTKTRKTEGGASVVKVSAAGFKGVKRVEFVTMAGDDGDLHDVPVEWIEYLPVCREREMAVAEDGTPQAAAIAASGAGRGGDGKALLRRRLVSRPV